jgi:hypothetical protein
MDTRGRDQPVLAYIQKLVEEEHRLYAQGAGGKTNPRRLEKIQIELRQRRALRRAGQDADEAEVRSPEIVENYEQ